MRFPLSLAISAPLYEVLPILALALFEADNIWHRRTLAHSTTWQWELPEVPEPAIIQLAIGDEPTKSLIRINGPTSKPSEALQKVFKQIMNMLREYEFDFKFVSINEAQKLALFIAPHEAPYLALAPLIATVVEKYGLDFQHPAADAMAPSNLQHIVQEAGLVIGVWDTLPGQSALYHAWREQRPLLALVRQKATAAKWLSPLIHYTPNGINNLAALDQAVAQRLHKHNPQDGLKEEGLNGQQKSTPNGKHRYGKAMMTGLASNQLLNRGHLVEHERRRRLIYREVALDQTLIYNVYMRLVS